MSSASEFGKDHGLLHEAVVTGRKAGWGSDEWGKLAHSEKRMRAIRDYLNGTAAIVPIKPDNRQTPKLLKSNGYYAAVRLMERHDPDAFYKTRDGLRVWDDFCNRIVAAAKPTDAGAKWKKLRRFELAFNATGQSLKDARPNAVWSASEFCAWLSIKLAAQKNGAAGELLNNGWANLYLVEGVGEVFVVDVRWDGDEWRGDTWRLDNEWGAGHWFGSRN